MKQAEFFTWLYEFCERGQLETRALPSQHRSFHELRDWGSVEKWYDEYSTDDVYFAVATRNGGGTKDHIGEIPAVWADIDFKDISRKEANKRLQEFPFKPSCIVESGGGYHCYWRLNEPAEKVEIGEVEECNRKISAFLGSDFAATDAARILRPPGTLNYKYEIPALVKVIHSNKYNYNIISILEGLPELKRPQRDSYGQNGTKPDIGFEKGNQDNSLFSVAWHLAKSGMEFENVLETVTFLAKQCDPNCDYERWANTKVQSAFSRLSGQNRTSLADEIRGWVHESSGTFTGQEVDNEFQIRTKVDKENRRKILQRLRSEGIIERVGKQRNMFRLVDKEYMVLDPFCERCDPTDLRLPFGEHNLVHLYPKNTIILSGARNAGKTAYCLSTVLLNQRQHRIWYMSSEMGVGELQVRLGKFKGIDWNIIPPDSNEPGVTFIERGSEWQDIIKPNAINIIDYMELHDEFWKVGGLIRKIFDKLESGIALICLQKKAGDKHHFGRGGEFSLENPRLALAMDKNKCMIVKAKNVKENVRDPEGRVMYFKIVGGADIEPKGDWR